MASCCCIMPCPLFDAVWKKESVSQARMLQNEIILWNTLWLWFEEWNNPSTILLSWEVCDAHFSEMRHIQVIYRVDHLWLKPYRETSGKAKNRSKPYQLALHHDHLPAHNPWKIQVYLEVRIMKSSICWLSPELCPWHFRFICWHAEYPLLTGGLWQQKW